MSLPFLRDFSRLGEHFDNSYLAFVRIGLSLCIWFSVFAHAAHDLWASSVVFGLLSVLLLVLLTGHQRTKRSVQLPLVGPVLLFLGVLAVTTHSSYDVNTSRLECWTWFFSFIGFYLLINTALTPEHWSSFFDVSSLILFPLALMCLFERMTGRVEIHATLINSIIMSGFVLYWIFYVWERKSFRVSLLAALVIILLLGRSWSALIALSLGFMYYYKKNIKTINFKQFLLLPICFIAVMALVLLVFPHQGILEDKWSSFLDRLVWWRIAAKMVRQHPYCGVGLGAYSTAFAYFQNEGLHSLYAHSFPLQFIAETGLLGALSLIWLLRGVVSEIQTRRVFLATLVSVCLYSLININLEYFLNKFMLLFTLAPLIRMDKATTRIAGKAALQTVALITILLVPAWMRPWRASTYLVMGLQNETSSSGTSARACYRKALAIDETLADADAALAATYQRDYYQSRSPSDVAQWRFYMTRAFRWKKDIRFISALKDHDLLPAKNN